MLKMKAENRIIISGAGLLIALLSYAIYCLSIPHSFWEIQHNDQKSQTTSFSWQIKQKSDLPFCDTLSDEEQTFTQCQMR